MPGYTKILLASYSWGKWRQYNFAEAALQQDIARQAHPQDSSRGISQKCEQADGFKILYQMKRLRFFWFVKWKDNKVVLRKWHEIETKIIVWTPI